jgi:hypothetical protein
LSAAVMRANEIGEGGDQCAVPKITHGLDRNTVDELAPLDGIEHRRLPVFTTCFGPRTAAAGFIGITWPVMSQSNSMRTAASCCFTPGAPVVLLQLLHPSRHVERANGREREATIFAPGEEPGAGSGISPARVVVVDVGGEELDVAPAGCVAKIGNERRHYNRQ